MFLNSVTAIVVALSFAFAAESVRVPAMITANTNVNLDLNLEVSRGTGVHLDSYAVYLVIRPDKSVNQQGEKFITSRYGSCYLISSSPISTVKQTVQIPAPVGPSEIQKAYWIKIVFFNESQFAVDKTTGYRGFNSTLNRVNLSIDQVTEGPGFSLQGGNGQWSHDEIHGIGLNTLAQQDNVPCSAYDCARNCTATHYQHPLVDDPDLKNGKWPSFVEETYRCIQRCPGFTYIDIGDTAKRRGNRSHVGDDSLVYDDVITSTVLGPLSTTRTETVFLTSVSFQSVPSAGSAMPISFLNGTLIAGSAFPSSTWSRASTPTIAPTPSPKNYGSRSRSIGVWSLIGSGFTMLVLLGF
ncbi:uncharacterized protein RAG0_04839 [Rhynchosporium agropyri]|uniref:Uncharacterized protein n=1 Tax=Rhynchosporium agropyri TaxID=914238 RepID=A0A1E1KAK7_9HELO|nr:uncharacterized protein RAG0_04839 [Rhynchosporium agropyri]